jgi:hypothetical protein
MEYQTDPPSHSLSNTSPEPLLDSDQFLEFHRDQTNPDRIPSKPAKNLPHSFEFIPKTLLSLNLDVSVSNPLKSSLDHSQDSYPPAHSTDYSVSDELDRCDTEETDLSAIHLSSELKRDYLFSSVTLEDDARFESSIPFDINFQDMEEEVAPLPLPSSEFYRLSDIAYKRTPRKILKLTRPPVEKLNIFG